MKWKKHIGLNDARELSKKFSTDFSLVSCQVYYVDILEENTYGMYCHYDPPHILMLHGITVLNPLGILIHELTHHLEHQFYGEDTVNHGYCWILAKRKVIRWANREISSKPDWSLPLRAYQTNINMRKFRV